jgi:streptogramin lyase
MEGTPSRWQGRAAHDAVVGPDGNVYLSDETTLDASVLRLNPQTGEVSSFKFPSKKVPAVMWLESRAAQSPNN